MHPLTLLASFLSVLMMTDAASVCKSGQTWVPDPDDCSSFWLCLPFMTAKYKCPGDTVTNHLMEACVPKGSHMDICSKKDQDSKKTTLKSILTTTKAPELSPIEKMCQENPTAIIPHPQHCAKYINCSRIKEEHQGVGECPYPMLWEETSKKCAKHELTKCGERFEPIDPCDYNANICDGNSHCIPCEIRFPSCRGLSDGLQPWRGRERTPYFVVCSNQRLSRQGKCTYEKKGEVVFDPQSRKCIEV
ncbi:hypothetical protein FSP39_008390 [Pinctada imbricata]|uniref:Chitin-binding type-2 domain-containing protein n=1 Tax=Pinctada imbricata TaxID=66713 RepID=A0AA88YBJ2_PINIB|nr:hypothetical protein FSP39_008390 [Pinctada imbricata]